jgi:hypothetical protein
MKTKKASNGRWRPSGIQCCISDLGNDKRGV